MIDVCFVCTGNTCRSVMAERIARKLAKNRKMKNIKFSSAGVYATGENIADNAKVALKQLGYDGRNRKSVKLAKVIQNTIYVTVTNEHKKFVNSKKCLSFEEFGEKVFDPYQQSVEVYLKTAKQIETNVEILLDKIEKIRGEV